MEQKAQMCFDISNMQVNIEHLVRVLVYAAVTIIEHEI